jgi:hypothetical protein
VAESRQPPSLFSKLFQISACFRQAFPKKALAVLWDFKGLQGSQAISCAFQIFRPRRPPFAHIPDAPTPHSAARRGYRFQTANRDSQILVLGTALQKANQNPGKLEVFKSTLARISFFRSKIAALALLASKIEHRVVVGPDPLIVGSSAAGHHHISTRPTIPPSGARPEPPRGGTGAEDGRQGVLSARRDARGFRNRIRDFAVNGQRMSWPRHLSFP